MSAEAKKGLSPKVIIVGVAVVVVVAIVLFMTVGRGDPAVRAVMELPEMVVTLETADGDEVQIDVRHAATPDGRTAAFRGLPAEAMEDLFLYLVFPFEATAARSFENLRTDVDMAFFDREGELLQVFNVSSGSTDGYRPDDRYQYILIAKSGALADKGIEEGSSLVLTVR